LSTKIAIGMLPQNIPSATRQPQWGLFGITH